MGVLLQQLLLLLRTHSDARFTLSLRLTRVTMLLLRWIRLAPPSCVPSALPNRPYRPWTLSPTVFLCGLTPTVRTSEPPSGLFAEWKLSMSSMNQAPSVESIVA